jgi:hypothetical protein
MRRSKWAFGQHYIGQSTPHHKNTSLLPEQEKKTWSSVFDFGLVMLVKMNGLSSGLSFNAAGRPLWAWAAPPAATTWGQRYKTFFRNLRIFVLS